MEAPEPSPARRRVTLRNGLRLLGALVFLGLAAECVRVFLWTNQHTVIPGQLYRSAQLSPSQLQRAIQEHGIRTVLNTRGVCAGTPWYLGETRTTHAANVSQEDLSLSAKRLPAPSEVRRMIDILEHTEKPILVHCHQGADRTGLVSTAALLLLTPATLGEALQQLWPNKGHIRGGRTVVIDEFFELYQSWLAGREHSSNLFREWALNHYCPGPYRAELTLLGPNPPIVVAGQGFTLRIRAKNASVAAWQFKPGGVDAVLLRSHLFTAAGQKLSTAKAGRFDRVVAPGETIEFEVGFPPISQPGRYLIHSDLLDAQSIDLHDSDFVQYGSEPLVLELTVR